MEINSIGKTYPNMTTDIIAQSKQNEVQAEQIRGHFQYKIYNRIQTKNHKLQTSFNLQRRKHSVSRIQQGFKKSKQCTRQKPWLRYFLYARGVHKIAASGAVNTAMYLADATQA